MTSLAIAQRVTSRVATLALLAITLPGCTPPGTRPSQHYFRTWPVPVPFPDDDIRDWAVTDSAGHQHSMRLTQEATATGARLLTIQDNGRTLFTMTERWTKGTFGDWFLDTRELIGYSPESGALQWPVTPGKALARAVASHPDSIRTAKFQLTHSPRTEAGAGCGAYSLKFLAASLLLDASLVELANGPDATTYQASTTEAQMVGAGYDEYAKCVVASLGTRPYDNRKGIVRDRP